MVGTTRSRVSFFMNRFRKLGFVDYDGGSGLQVHFVVWRFTEMKNGSLVAAVLKGDVMSIV
jgi:hypothetical protein